MTAPAERLEAAIEKLETLKAGSAPGEWEFDAVEKDIYDYNTSLQLALRPDKFMAGDFAANADLIVTLHRTIDAQLNLLRLTRGFYGAQITGPESSTSFAELGFALATSILATSILGGES